MENNGKNFPKLMKYLNIPIRKSENFKKKTHSSTFAWKIPWTEEPSRLQSMGLLRVGGDWATSLSRFTLTHWRRKWQPTPVFFPGDSQGRGSLVGCCLWGCTESETTEATSQQQQQQEEKLQRKAHPDSHSQRVPNKR